VSFLEGLSQALKTYSKGAPFYNVFGLVPTSVVSALSGSDPLVVENQLYTAGALVSFYAYTIGKLSNHKAR
jgi:predicted DNA-binding helix-hairpin-helix protein